MNYQQIIPVIFKMIKTVHDEIIDSDEKAEEIKDYIKIIIEIFHLANTKNYGSQLAPTEETLFIECIFGMAKFNLIKVSSFDELIMKLQDFVNVFSTICREHSNSPRSFDTFNILCFMFKENWFLNGGSFKKSYQNELPEPEAICYDLPDSKTFFHDLYENKHGNHERDLLRQKQRKNPELKKKRCDRFGIAKIGKHRASRMYQLLVKV